MKEFRAWDPITKVVIADVVIMENQLQLTMNSNPPKSVQLKDLAKNQFQAFMQALVHNLKRLIKIEPPPLIFA
jgi:hypothetical protein